MRVYSNRNVAIGDVILGSDGDWWKVTTIIAKPDGYPEFYARRQGRAQLPKTSGGKSIRKK